MSPRYRFYTQNAANHYRARYAVAQSYVTSDKELSPLSSHRIALELDRLWHFEAVSSTFATTLSVAALFYNYTDFIPLDHITAFEANFAVVFTL